MNDKEAELEQNLLVSWFEDRFGFLKPYYKTIATCSGLIFLAVILGVIIFKYNRDAYASQWNQLNLSVTNWSYDRNTSHLTDLAEQMPDVPASLWALQLAGDFDMSEGLSMLANPLQARDSEGKPLAAERVRSDAIKKIRKAQESYQKVLESSAKRSPMLEHRTVFSLGYAAETLGEWDDAKKYFSQIVDSAPDSEFLDAAKAGLNRIGNKDLVAFYDNFRNRKMGPAPGIELDRRPDTFFPDIDAMDDGDNSFVPNKDGDAAPAPGENVEDKDAGKGDGSDPDANNQEGSNTKSPDPAKEASENKGDDKGSGDATKTDDTSKTDDAKKSDDEKKESGAGDSGDGSETKKDDTSATSKDDANKESDQKNTNNDN